MTVHQVSHYSAVWDEDADKGAIAVFEGATFVANVNTSSPAEFQLIIDLLRNERPVIFETVTRHFRVGFSADREPVGEEET